MVALNETYSSDKDFVLALFDRYFHEDKRAISAGTLRSILVRIGVTEAAADVLMDGKETVEYEVFLDWLFAVTSAAPSRPQSTSACKEIAPALTRAADRILESRGSSVSGLARCRFSTNPLERQTSRGSSESGQAMSRVASQILERQSCGSDDSHCDEFADGCLLRDSFYDVFQTLSGGSVEGIARAKLRAALQEFAMTLESPWVYRVTLVIVDVFSRPDVLRASAVTWAQLERCLSYRSAKDRANEEAISTIFELCANPEGRIDAQELMDLILLLSSLRDKAVAEEDITPAMVGCMIRDLDFAGDGSGLDIVGFAELLRAARSQPLTREVGFQPHLELNFDINNTILMCDSATGSSAERLITTVAANSSWGRVEKDPCGGPSRWILQRMELTDERPEEGLQTYAEFVSEMYPLKASKRGSISKEQDDSVKSKRRQAMWSFTEPGNSGEALQPVIDDIRKALMLPADVRGTEAALGVGLTGETVQLLPSFLHFLNEIASAGRSFTLVFRTFGKDLPRLQQEFNAFCEGRHPLFPGVLLDGSDGKPDYRLFLDAKGCGTFFRDPLRGDLIALVMGSIEQPPPSGPGLAYYDDHDAVEIWSRPEAVAARFFDLGSRCRTFALRDYYPGWASVGSKSHGGKPFFLRDDMDTSVHSIFFDDHIQPTDCKIVDPIHVDTWSRRFGASQLFGVHLVQSQPLRAVQERGYFVDCLRSCEEARASRIRRMRLLHDLVGDQDAMQRLLEAVASCDERPTSLQDLRSRQPEPVLFRPWSRSRRSRCTSRASTFLDDFPFG